jgi:hypothetical protein
MAIEFKQRKVSPMEKFGVYYLNLFRKKDNTTHVFEYTDEQLVSTVNRISYKGMFLSALTGFICVWPSVYIGVLMQDKPWYIQYGWVAVVTLVSVIIEFYLLFVIALKAVHEVSELTNLRMHDKDFLQDGPFSITNILSRAALELPDPEMHILGIDPFKLVSKKNLLLLGLLYKCKIVLTNFIARWLLTHTAGKTIFRISINYIALPVECFWNALVIQRVVHEARLRLFGFALCNHLADHILEQGLLDELSPEAKNGCIRAIGNAVVLAKNYHPNMIVLLLRFQHLLHINKDHHYDDWGLFLKTLEKVSLKERFFLLNLFTIAAAFDGRISHLEADTMKDAYGEYYDKYHPRLITLTNYLKSGRLHAAAALCKIDFTEG